MTATSPARRFAVLGLVLVVVAGVWYAAVAADTVDSRTDSAPRARAAAHTGPDRSAAAGKARHKRNCVTRLRACGYPSAATTGVKNERKLKKSGSVTADRDGQVVENLDITGEINITASNVVVRNVRVSASDGDWVVIIRPGAENVTIKDSEIMSPAGATVDNACIFNISDTRPRMVRLDIHGCSAGVSSGGGRLRDSYIHDPGYTPGLSHITLVASNSDGHFTIKHNTILNPYDQTAAVAFYQDFGAQSDNLVVDNLLAGGGYVVYGGNGDYAETHDIRFVGNRISRIYHRRGGYYGVVASFDRHNPGNEWSGNYWDDTLKAVHG
jgi:hypothetical protein